MSWLSEVKRMGAWDLERKWEKTGENHDSPLLPAFSQRLNSSLTNYINHVCLLVLPGECPLLDRV